MICQPVEVLTVAEGDGPEPKVAQAGQGLDRVKYDVRGLHAAIVQLAGTQVERLEVRELLGNCLEVDCLENAPRKDR